MTRTQFLGSARSAGRKSILTAQSKQFSKFSACQRVPASGGGERGAGDVGFETLLAGDELDELDELDGLGARGVGATPRLGPTRSITASSCARVAVTCIFT